jgi:hypothetical protein
VSTIEELLERKSSGSGLENREYCLLDPSRWPRGTLYPRKLALTSVVGIICPRTQTTEFSFQSRQLYSNLQFILLYTIYRKNKTMKTNFYRLVGKSIRYCNGIRGWTTRVQFLAGNLY